MDLVNLVLMLCDGVSQIIILDSFIVGIFYFDYMIILLQIFYAYLCKFTVLF